MPEVSEEQFIDACKQVVKANVEYVPPYGTGATLYLRPFVIGVGDNIGVKPAPEYIFCVFCLPVGPYFKGGMAPVNFTVSEFDRAAPFGTGAAKWGAITLQVCTHMLKPLKKDLLTAFIWIQRHIPKLKKLALLIFSA